jgi:Cof subfamily protein (haloacid dehalogenase superfamily)
MQPANLPSALAHPSELEQFAKVELIAFDLDGTLIRQPNDVPGTKLAGLLTRLRGERVHVTLATGRTYAGASRVVGSVEILRKIPLVLYNGSVVMHSDGTTIVSSTAIDLDAVTSVIDMSAEVGADVLLYCVQDHVANIGETERVYYLGKNQAPGVEFNGMHVHLGWSRLAAETAVAMLISSSDPSILPALRKRLSAINLISVTHSGNKYIEIRPARSTKESGIARLAASLNVARAHVLAVGDNDNDVELLKWAGIGVCVANASAEAMAASRYITHYGAADGAIEVLDLVRRAQRLAKGGKKREFSY